MVTGVRGAIVRPVRRPALQPKVAWRLCRGQRKRPQLGEDACNERSFRHLHDLRSCATLLNGLRMALNWCHRRELAVNYSLRKFARIAARFLGSSGTMQYTERDDRG